MIDVLLPIFLLSLLIYLLRHLASGFTPSRSRYALPTHRLSQPERSGGGGGGGGWILETSHRTISLYTAAFNHVPKQIVKRWNKGMKRVYDVGALVGLLGSVVSIGGAMWALGEVWRTVWMEASIHAAEKGAGESVDVGSHLVKRAVEYMAVGAGSLPSSGWSSSGGFQPLIPGVTVPMSHLPTLTLALIINQLIHELGHALSAALDDVSPSRLSFNVHMIVPSMIVSFPPPVDLLPARAQLRLAASGPWHNLLTYGWFWVLALSGVSSVLWKDISRGGRVVQWVDPLSPLHDYLVPGQLITHLDGVFIGGQEDLWTTYLTSNDIGDADQGWCIDRTVYEALRIPPCAASDQISFTLTISSSTHGVQTRCLSPHPLLDLPSIPCPCRDPNLICIRPSPEEHILRIQTDKKKDGVVIWAGDRRGVVESVKVGNDSPRVFGPLIRWTAMFFEYMVTIALSLFFFNLLPLPHTDGSHLLRSFLAFLPSRRSSTTQPLSHPMQKPFRAILIGRGGGTSPSPNINLYRAYEFESDDEEDGDEDGDEEGRREMGRREEKWKRRLRSMVEVGMVGVLGGWAGGWAMLALLRSS